MIKIVVPMLAPSLNGPKGLIRMHFSAYKKVKDLWTWEIRSQAGTTKADIPCSIVIDRYFASQPMDLDNLYASAKVPLDALRASGVIPNDDPSCVTWLNVHQHKVSTREEQRTVITIK